MEYWVKLPDAANRKPQISIGILDVSSMETQEVMDMDPPFRMTYGKVGDSGN